MQIQNAEPEGFYDCMDFWDAKHGIVIGDAIKDELFIMTTEDGGAHWNRIAPSALPRAQTGEGSFAASGRCLVTLPGGHAWIVASTADHARLLHTSNYGRSWTVDTIPITTRNGVGPQAVAFRDSKNGVLLGGGAASKPTDMHVAVTHDGGRTWTARTRMPQSSGAWGGVFVPGSKPPAIVAVGPAGASYTRDDGVTWTAIDALNYWSVGFASPRAGWAVGTNGRITKLSGF